jgi:hypothetical protein
MRRHMPVAMDSFQASLWRDMAKEALAAADRIGEHAVRRELFLMAARYMGWPNGLKSGRQSTEIKGNSSFSQFGSHIVQVIILLLAAEMQTEA